MFKYTPRYYPTRAHCDNVAHEYTRRESQSGLPPYTPSRVPSHLPLHRRHANPGRSRQGIPPNRHTQHRCVLFRNRRLRLSIYVRKNLRKTTQIPYIKCVHSVLSWRRDRRVKINSVVKNHTCTNTVWRREGGRIACLTNRFRPGKTN